MVVISVASWRTGWGMSYKSGSNGGERSFTKHSHVRKVNGFRVTGPAPVSGGNVTLFDYTFPHIEHLDANNISCRIVVQHDARRNFLRAGGFGALLARTRRTSRPLRGRSLCASSLGIAVWVNGNHNAICAIWSENNTQKSTGMALKARIRSVWRGSMSVQSG
jgi:hypothetical protein